MHFIFFLDKLRKEELVKNSLKDPNNTFHFYKEIELSDLKTENKFICLKKQYTNFLIESKDSRKLYLSDYDIVCILKELLEKNKEIGMEIIESMYEFIKGKNFDFSFKLKSEKDSYKHRGIPFVEKNIKIDTKADFKISINDFIAIINLILAKEELVKNKNQVEGILCKYICLAEYYGEKNIIAKKILKEKQYKVEKSLEESEYFISKSGQNKFLVDKDIFLKLKNV